MVRQTDITLAEHRANRVIDDRVRQPGQGSTGVLLVADEQPDASSSPGEGEDGASQAQHGGGGHGCHIAAGRGERRDKRPACRDAPDAEPAHQRMWAETVTEVSAPLARVDRGETAAPSEQAGRLWRVLIGSDDEVVSSQVAARSGRPS